MRALDRILEIQEARDECQRKMNKMVNENKNPVDFKTEIGDKKEFIAEAQKMLQLDAEFQRAISSLSLAELMAFADTVKDDGA